MRTNISYVAVLLGMMGIVSYVAAVGKTNANPAGKRLSPIILIFALLICAATTGCGTPRLGAITTSSTPEGSRITTIPIPSNSWSFTIAEGYVWIIQGGLFEHKISKLDLQNYQTVATIPIGLYSVAVGEGALWGLTWGDGWGGIFYEPSLYRIDPKNNEVVAKIVIKGVSEGKVVVGAGSVWIMGRTSGTVIRVDTKTNQVVAEIRVGPERPSSFAGVAFYSGLAFGEDCVWVLDGYDATVSRIDPKTNQVVAKIAVGRGSSYIDPNYIDPNIYSGIAVGEGGIWVANQKDNLVLKIDPRENRIVRAIYLSDGALPTTTATGDDAVYVLTRGGRYLTKIDSQANQVTENIRISDDGMSVSSPLIFNEGAIWVIDPARPYKGLPATLKKININSVSPAKPSHIDIRP